MHKRYIVFIKIGSRNKGLYIGCRSTWVRRGGRIIGFESVKANLGFHDVGLRVREGDLVVPTRFGLQFCEGGLDVPSCPSGGFEDLPPS